MGLYKNLSQLSWSILSSRKTKSNYIPNDSDLVDKITHNQKESAKKAIEWLVSKSPHNINDIAEHFDMSPVLVAILVCELIRDNRLILDPNNPELVTINEKFSN